MPSATGAEYSCLMICFLTDRSIPYNNEEDWAARAKAWATATSGMESHLPQSHFASVGRTDEHGYHNQYQSAVGPPRDVQQASCPQFSQQLPVPTMDPLKQVNQFHGSTSYRFGSSSYGTGYNAGEETARANTDYVASSQRSHGLSSSLYEQEVSYSYSSPPGNTLLAFGFLCTSINVNPVTFSIKFLC